jgi:hypothetical protein
MRCRLSYVQDHKHRRKPQSQYGSQSSQPPHQMSCTGMWLACLHSAACSPVRTSLSLMTRQTRIGLYAGPRMSPQLHMHIYMSCD